MPELEQPPQPKRSAAMILLSGVVTFAFLGWLCWLITGIVLTGIPEQDRADVVVSLTIAAVGLVLSAVLASRTAETKSPLGFLGNLATALKALRRGG